jgi:hypothetical protein
VHFVACCALAFVTLALGRPARADQIILGDTNYPRARVTGFSDGQLLFVSIDGAERAAPISDVRLIYVDSVSGFADFNEAEKLVGEGLAAQALARYERSWRLGKRFWPDLIATRLLAACDKAERIDRATLNFIRVARGKHSGPKSAAMLIPQAIPTKRTPEVVRAVEQLDAVLRKVGNDSEEALFRLLRYGILTCMGSDRADEDARVVAGMRIPAPVRSARAYEIQLSAMEKALTEVTEAALSGLDRAIEDCPDEQLADFLLLKGRLLLNSAETREEIIRASWPFLRVTIHMPGDPRAAEGLLGAATALERLGQPVKAIQLLEECLAHSSVGNEVRSEAEAAMKRLTAESAGS